MNTTKRQSVTGPTKNDIQTLFREIGRGNWSYESPELSDLDSRIEALEERLLSDKSLMRLKAQRDALSAKVRKERKLFLKTLGNLRREFYAHGATPSVLKKVQAFVDEFNQVN